MNRMTKTVAAVMTAKGVGAISSVELLGQQAAAIVSEIFKPSGSKDFTPAQGSILTGNIKTDEQVIDHVVVGCEGEDLFSISCHGNPIIVEMIMKLLKDRGAEPVSSDKLLTEKFACRGNLNAIELQAKTEQLKAVSLEGVKLIAGQTFSKVLSRWLDEIETTSLEEIHKECESILKDSEIADILISGCKVVIAGPANSGKSTLLNCLCGREKAIVADIAGTTRDWVSATCRLDQVVMELIDTAGLDESIAVTGSVDEQSQKRSQQMLEDCDLVLLVLDASEEKVKFDRIVGKKTIAVFNKSDLGKRLCESDLGFSCSDHVTISAKTGDGIDKLLEKIPQVLETKGFDTKKPVCFTEGQKTILSQVLAARDRQQAKSLITQLLNGKVSV